ncbi:hypothetical protein [Microtetraspora malaysiensis]|uniref:hypothetical protein n=1 Tax=Microtetraspora malaysiensis TaxID=161358 RepID=UPI003D90FFA1
MALLASPVLAGCNAEKVPTASEAGKTLQVDVLHLLREVTAQNVTIIDSGGKEIPCGEGKAKQTFSATGQDVSPKRARYTLRVMLVGALRGVDGYVVDGVPDPLNQPVRVKSESKKVALALDSPEDGTYVVGGETQCLPRT